MGRSIVQVDWVDAVFQERASLVSDIAEPYMEHSVGYMLKQDEESISICETLDMDMYRAILTIPSDYIRHIELLKEGCEGD